MQLRLATFVCLAATVAAQSNNYTAGLAAALQAAGLTSLAGALAAAPAGLVSALQQGNHTVFAPSNAAFAGFDLATAKNVSNILAYHVLAGVINTTSLNSSTSIVRTSLAGSPAVLLPGNQSQVLALSKAENGTVLLQNFGKSIPVTQNATYQNLDVRVIDTVLRIPGNLTTAIGATPDISALGGIVNGIPGLVTTLQNTTGLTIFAPSNAAIAAAQATLGQVNGTVVSNVLLNHIINGTALYSPLITSSTNITGAGGEPLTFATNSSGTYVTSGSSSAKIVTPNILIENGVIHVIDTILLNTASNPAAASSAASSIASSEAQNTGSQTGAVSPTSSTGAALGVKEMNGHFGLLATLVAGAVLGASLL